MKKRTKNWDLIGQVIMSNIISIFVLFFIVLKGHSSISFLISILVPLIALFSYLGYFKFSSDSEIIKRRILYLSINPNILISIIILLFMFLVGRFYGAHTKDYYRWLINFFKIVIPNIGIQLLILLIVKKNINSE